MVGTTIQKPWSKVKQLVCYFHCFMYVTICSILVLLRARFVVAQRSSGWADSGGLSLLAGHLKPLFPFPCESNSIDNVN